MEHALALAVRIAQQPGPEMLDGLSEVVGEYLPHRVAAHLAIYCASTPVRAVGEPDLAAAVTGVELGALLAYVTAGKPWQGTVPIAGGNFPVLAVASDRAPSGALVVFVRPDAEPLPEETVAMVQGLWDLVTTFQYQLTLTAQPEVLARSRAIAQARETAVAELSEAHAAAMAGLLGVLRSRQLDDATARASAIDLALNALEDLRAEAERRKTPGGEEPVGRAFQRLAESLRPLLRHGPVELELDPPAESEFVPSDVAHAARITTRAVVLAVLQQDAVRRVRVGWQLRGHDLLVLVRDDGPGEVSGGVDLGQLAERVRTQRGQFEVDATPGWGLTIRATLPLDPRAPRHPLAELGPRETEVLQRIALGQRNREIAADLHLSESTVKFHVANILAKLGVGSRTEAAAVFHSSGS
ncbi:helix-turn-helix transcriptional regulator [Amycolatopsis jejuensis]|uniref:helix-turn-helix transcriptional regulator n=1 Tax=Amycolatopsis jejuensis TaxID=330084 RepID=UPI000527E613|nr:response regulator transcription factor [Amycolatopsis jejuensis]